MFTIDLAGVGSGPVTTDVEIPADHAVLQDLAVRFAGPVRVTGRLTESGPGRYYWQAEVAGFVHATCRRCLTPVDVPLQAPVNVLFCEDPGADDASIYVIPAQSRELDLSEAIREELLLALPEYVLCRDDCRGLCAGCGNDLNTGACTCEPDTDPRWSVLSSLKRPQ